MHKIKPPPQPPSARGRPRALSNAEVKEARDMAKNALRPNGKPYSVPHLALLFGVTAPTMRRVLEGVPPYDSH